MALIILKPIFVIGFDQSSDHLEKRLKLEKRLRAINFKSCNKVFDRFIELRLKDANALCRPYEYRAKSADARSTLKRLKTLRKTVDERWHFERHLEKQVALESVPPHEDTSLSYAMLSQHLFSQYSMQCSRFNDIFSDSLILIHQVFPKCRKNIRFEAYRHEWRSNILQNVVYKEMSGSGARPTSQGRTFRSPASGNNH